MSSDNIEVVTPAPVEVDVVVQQTTLEVTTEQTAVVEVESAQVQTNLWVTDTYPGFTTAGLWIQTNVNGQEGAVTLNLVYDDGT